MNKILFSRCDRNLLSEFLPNSLYEFETNRERVGVILRPARRPHNATRVKSGRSFGYPSFACSLARLPACACFHGVRLSSVSSSANAGWPRQLAGASNDTQRRRAAVPSLSSRPSRPSRPTSCPLPRDPADGSAVPRRDGRCSRAPIPSPSLPFLTAHARRRPVLGLPSALPPSPLSYSHPLNSPRSFSVGSSVHPVASRRVCSRSLSLSLLSRRRHRLLAGRPTLPTFASPSFRQPRDWLAQYTFYF